MNEDQFVELMTLIRSQIDEAASITGIEPEVLWRAVRDMAETMCGTGH